jgi:hypothetical protein
MNNTINILTTYDFMLLKLKNGFVDLKPTIFVFLEFLEFKLLDFELLELNTEEQEELKVLPPPHFTFDQLRKNTKNV